MTARPVDGNIFAEVTVKVSNPECEDVNAAGLGLFGDSAATATSPWLTSRSLRQLAQVQRSAGFHLRKSVCNTVNGPYEFGRHLFVRFGN
jgi:hypothetical protein